MKSKLGVYQISKDDLPLEWWSCQPTVAVSMFHNDSYWREVKRISPATRIMGRYYFDDDWPSAQDAFNRMRGDVERMQGIYDIWMTWNEIVLNSESEARGWSARTVELAQLLHGIGAKVAAYSFATGNPKVEYWPYLWDGLRACDALCLHEYSAPEMSSQSPWLCLRYRDVYARMPADLKSKPLWIGETGIDGGVIGQAQQGWKRYGSEAHYLDSLKWYDAELQKDPQVVGGAIFAAAWDQGQTSFNIKECNSIREYIASGGSPEPTPMPTPGGTMKDPTIIRYSGVGPYFKLTDWERITGNDIEIRVQVFNEDGTPDLTTPVEHWWPQPGSGRVDGAEHFPCVLKDSGGGVMQPFASFGIDPHTSVADAQGNGPHNIRMFGVSGDWVTGMGTIHGGEHVVYRLVFQKVNGTTPPPPPPPPGPEPSSDTLTRARLARAAEAFAADLRKEV